MFDPKGNIVLNEPSFFRHDPFTGSLRMPSRPLTYFLTLSLAAHAGLFGLWPEAERTTPRHQENSIEIGLVMLPKLEKDFRQERVQAQVQAPAATAAAKPFPTTIIEPTRTSPNATDPAAPPVTEERTVEGLSE